MPVFSKPSQFFALETDPVTWSIPNEWQRLILEYRAKVDPTAVIAGGCLRDCFYGVEHKDVDLFSQSFGTLEGWDSSRDCQTPAFDYSQLPNIEAATIYRDYADEVINLVKLKDIEPIEYMKQFDMGFCQIAYDGDKITTTKAFDDDYLNHQVTLCKITYYSQSIARFERINKRYGRRLIIPALEKLNAQVNL